MSEIVEYCPDAKILLVALKCDLRDNEELLARKNISPVLYEEVTKKKSGMIHQNV